MTIFVTSVTTRMKRLGVILTRLSRSNITLSSNSTTNTRSIVVDRSLHRTGTSYTLFVTLSILTRIRSKMWWPFSILVHQSTVVSSVILLVHDLNLTVLRHWGCIDMSHLHAHLSPDFNDGLWLTFFVPICSALFCPPTSICVMVSSSFNSPDHLFLICFSPSPTSEFVWVLSLTYWLLVTSIKRREVTGELVY